MAKRGPKPGGSKIEDLPPTLLESIESWADSNRKHSAVSIYRRFDLVGRDISIATFRRWLKSRRKVVEGQLEPDASPRFDRGPTPEDMMLSLLVERAESGDPKHFAAIGSALRALCDYRRLGFDEAAERRAQELHAARVEKLAPSLKDTDETPKTQTARDVRDLLEQLAAGKIGVVEAHQGIGRFIWDEIDKIMRGEAE